MTMGQNMNDARVTNHKTGAVAVEPTISPGLKTKGGAMRSPMATKACQGR